MVQVSDFETMALACQVYITGIKVVTVAEMEPDTCFAET